MVSFVHTHRRANVIQTEQVTFRNIHVYTYMDLTTINKKEAMDLKERKEGLEQGKGRAK